MELLILAIALLFSGAVAGVMAGLLGVGGGIVIVPVLFHVFSFIDFAPEVRMHLAVGTSLATIIPTSIRSVISHHKKGAVDFDLIKTWTPGIIIGVIIGSVIASYANHQVLTLVFATIALVFAANMAFGKDEWRLSDHMPSTGVQTFIASIMGVVSTLMGIGGGTMGVTIMTLYNMDVRRAVATAAGLGVIISIPATLGFILSGLGMPDRPAGSFGYVNLIGFALIVPTTVLMAPYGAELAHRMDRKMLIRFFALFLAITSVKMYSDLVG